MRNGIRRKLLCDRQKLALRFLLAIEKPEHGAKVFPGGPKLRIQPDGFAVEFLRFGEILKLGISNSDLLAHIRVGGFGTMQLQQNRKRILSMTLFEQGLRAGERRLLAVNGKQQQRPKQRPTEAGRRHYFPSHTSRSSAPVP